MFVGMSIVVLAVFGHALRSYLALNRTCHRCEMSFMSPKYVQVFRASGFALYEYLDAEGAGEWQQQAAALDVPAAFVYVPGNAASYKQVRSLGSELKRRCSRCRIYSCDFGGQLTAFDPQALRRQIAFLQQALPQALGAAQDVVLIGHSMGGVVAKAAACAHEGVKRVVLLGTPSAPPLPAIPFQRLFDQAECSSHAAIIHIQPGANDIQAAGEGRSPPRAGTNADLQVRVDAVALCWSDPHHQAMVWCNSLMQAIADNLLDGVPLNKDPVDSIGHGSKPQPGCGDVGPLTGHIITGLKYRRDFDIISRDSNSVQLKIIPGKYRDAVYNAKVATCIPIYLTLISGSDLTLRKYCNRTDVFGRQSRYFGDASRFEDLLDLQPYDTPFGKLDFSQAHVKTSTRYLMPRSIYSVAQPRDCIVSVAFPDGSTELFPEGDFLSGPFGKYTITTISVSAGTGPAKLAISLTRTAISKINSHKRDFQKGLLLGLTRKCPLLYLLMIILAGACGCSMVPLVSGFVVGAAIYHLFLNKESKEDPYYAFGDDQFMLKPLCMAMSIVSLPMSYPSCCITMIPCLLYALFDRKKRLKSVHILTAMLFELVAASVSAYESGGLWGWRGSTSTMLKALPIAFNYALAMHVEKLIFLPFAVLFRDLPVPSAIIAAVGAAMARDHERYMAKNLDAKHKAR